MDVESSNKIISIVVALIQTTLVVAIAVACTRFFLEPDKRKETFSFIPQWHMEAGKLEVKTRTYPPPPLFMPKPKSESTASVDEPQETEFYLAPLLTFLPPKPPPLKGNPITFEKKTVAGIPLYVATVSLKDPETFLTLALPHDAKEANSARKTYGVETFNSFVARLNAAVVQNGTFFSKDNEKRVMGNMVANGRWLKYSRWENYGTTFGLKKGNIPEMVTARIDGKPNWQDHWFSLTCGPRLVKNGQVEINAEQEGFADPHVLGAGSRCALGYPAGKDKIFLVTFLRGLSLKKEAKVMQAMGCVEAMNLDGGASRAIAHSKNIVVPASRPLTNVIVVYDTSHPAPLAVKHSWRNFQRNRAMIQLIR